MRYVACLIKQTIRLLYIGTMISGKYNTGQSNLIKYAKAAKHVVFY